MSSDPKSPTTVQRDSRVAESTIDFAYTVSSKSYIPLFQHLLTDLEALKSEFERELTKIFIKEKDHTADALTDPCWKFKAAMNLFESHNEKFPNLPRYHSSRKASCKHCEEAYARKQAKQQMARRALENQEMIRKILLSVWPQNEYASLKAMDHKCKEARDHRQPISERMEISTVTRAKDSAERFLSETSLIDD